MESLQVLVVPLPVADTVSVSVKMVEPSNVETCNMHVKVVRAVVLSVMLSVRLTVPLNTAAGASSVSSVTAGRARNAPVCGSRIPRIPCCLAWVLAA